MKGVGDFLAVDLKRLWIKEKAGCGCKNFQRKLNQLGPAGCIRNREWILNELEKKAKRFNYPFVRTPAGWLLDRAIRLATKEEQKWREDSRSFQARHANARST